MFPSFRTNLLQPSSSSKREGREGVEVIRRWSNRFLGNLGTAATLTAVGTSNREVSDLPGCYALSTGKQAPTSGRVVTA
jgi:hypothetical protein